MRLSSLALVCASTIVACSEVDDADDQPFEGQWSGECEMVMDGGTLSVFSFDLDATYDDATGDVSGTVTTVSYQGETLTGELTGFVTGAAVDLKLYGEGVVDSGNYSFDMDLSGERVDWWIEGSCTNSSGETGTLFMR